MKYLVTGCAGFIGSTLTDRLLEKGHQVIGIDNMTTGILEFLDVSSKHENFKFIKADLIRKEDWVLAMQGVDVVYHMAANADIRGGLHEPQKDIENNTIATFNVLEAMREHGVKKIIFASSAAALGEPDVFPTPETCPIPDQTSLYGASKMACEGLISSYCEGFGFEGYAFRFVSLLGPRYPHGHVFDFVKQLVEDPKKLRILGDGKQRKSYLHIDDCVKALFHICEGPYSQENKARYHVFHLGYPGYCQVEDSARWICETLGVEPVIELTGGDRGWVGDNPFVFLDVSKALATGWRPENTIESSVRETAQWLMDNQWILARR